MSCARYCLKRPLGVEPLRLCEGWITSVTMWKGMFEACDACFASVAVHEVEGASEKP